MKSILFLAFMCAPMILFCQSEPTNHHVKSKIETLLEENGTFLETTMEEIGTVSYSVSIKVIRLKNLITGVKTSGIFFESNSGKSIIDADEMDLLVKSLNLMKEAANSTRTLQTEIRFKSRTGLIVAAIFDSEKKDLYNNTKTSEKKWMYALKFDPKKSGDSLRPSDFMALCGFIEAAKSKM